ncbi:MAG: glutamyl-tRNA reductase [Thermoplasmata archaeon]
MADILSAHVTHKWVDIEKLELFVAKEARSLLHSVHALDSIDEVVLLKTCNRVELYTATEDLRGAHEGLSRLASGLFPEELNGAIRYMENAGSIKHLMKVAAGLESMIVGEDQILGQIKEAHGFAREEGTIGRTLDLLFRKAISVGKKVRNATMINKGSVSIGSAAVELAERLLGSLRGRTILVMGAGEIASLVAKALAGRDLKAIFVANKTHWRAVEMAQQLGGLAIRFEELPHYIPISDLVIGATSAPHVVLSKDDLAGMLQFRSPEEKLLIIDLGNPRNVEEAVAEIPGVVLRNLDGLREIAAENVERRRREIRHAEEIIEQEMPLLIRKFQEGKAEAINRTLYQKADKILQMEYEELASRLKGLDEEGMSIIESFARSLTKKLLAGPSKALREASRQGDIDLLRAAERLFETEE